jgi:bifunctional non-homologous end joining protein LigD
MRHRARQNGGVIRFGVSGLPPEDMEPGAFLDQLVEQGHSAYELAFVKSFPWSEKQCGRFGEEAAGRGIALSLHAPYFAILTVEEEERSKQCLSALEHSMKLGRALGSRVIVAHTGHIGERSADELTSLVQERLDRLAPKVTELGVGLGLETSGSDRAFGSLGDIARFAAEFPFVRPVVDWAHLHAKTGAGLVTKQAFATVLGFLRESFAGYMIDPLHAQFTDNLVGPHGEVRHLPYGDGTLRVGPLVEAVREAELSMVMISEAREQESHDAILAEIRSVEERAAPPPGRSLDSGTFDFPSRIRARQEAAGRWAPIGLARPLTVSNIDKVFFPDSGITKGDLIQYYASVADVLLPHLVDRPLSMSRYPNGIADKSFYEKRAPGHAPDWIDTRPVASDSMGGTVNYVVAHSRETLMWLANMAAIEVHPFHSHHPTLGMPDYAVFDLDPAEGSTWEQVVSAAKLLRVALDRLELRGYPKLSGARGLHVYVPLDPVHTHERVRTFVDAVGQLMASANGDDITMEWDIPKRKGKVFVDANRNASGQTVASVYSVRPRPGAPISYPIRWEEVGEARNGDVTVGNLWERLQRHGDLFRPVAEGGQRLDAAEQALHLA